MKKNSTSSRKENTMNVLTSSVPCVINSFFCSFWPAFS